jgi:hypothetical protein
MDSGNKIEAIEGLNGCFKLKELSLCDNKLTSLKGLGRLTILDVRLAPGPSALATLPRPWSFRPSCTATLVVVTIVHVDTGPTKPHTVMCAYCSCRTVLVCGTENSRDDEIRYMLKSETT